MTWNLLLVAGGVDLTEPCSSWEPVQAIALENTVYVMSARPGRIIDTISVDFAHPRSYELSTEPAFMELKRRIQNSLHGEVHKALTDAA